MGLSFLSAKGIRSHRDYLYICCIIPRCNILRLQEEFDKPYFERLVSFVKSEYGRAHVLPPGHLIFHVFNSCPFEKVKVVILGQDPYPTPGQYYGICFSVPEGVAIPGSLVNIFSGNLDRWVAQGVFSLNSVLTVRAHETGSHRNMGWETFTDAVIKKLSDEREHLVFMLWGAYAKEKAALIDRSKHLILTTVHPSPRSAEYGFFGCKHFSKANNYLRSKGIDRLVERPGTYNTPFTPQPNNAKSPKQGSSGKTSAKAEVMFLTFFRENVSVSVSPKRRATRQT